MANFARSNAHRWAMRLTWIMAVAIAIATLAPAAELPPPPGSDKLHHVLAFAALCVPLAITRSVSLWKLGMSALAFGAMIEIIQPFVNRYGEWADLLADGGGVVLGLSLGTVMAQIIPKLHRM